MEIMQPNLWVQWQFENDYPESNGNGSVSTLQSDGYSSMYQKTTVGFIKDEEEFICVSK
jgi:hypothetical protein